MQGKMKAQMFYAPGDVRFEETEIPQISDDEMLVKVKAALTCGTDLKTYRRGHPTIIQSVPSTFGHEFASEVVKVGKNVTNFKVGDRVVGANTAPCFECENCKNKRYSLCTNLQYLNGAYSEYVAVPSHILKYNFYKIPDGLPYEQAALLEPLACAVHGVDRIPAKVGDKVVVIGAGPIGLMFMNLLVLKGCQVIAVDLSDYRLDIAKEKFGVYQTVNAKEDSHIQEVKNICGGSGADIVVEATGFPNVWENAVNMVRPGGTVLAFGGTKAGTSITLDCQKFHYEEITLMAVYHHTPYHVNLALKLLANGLIDGSKYISGYYPLEGAIDALESIGRQEGIKYVITPEESDRL
ncbi:MAG TPA: alcohol dehydrogenase catalytic domain-containing protein [Candidatus Anaerostipes excrementavium]|uniref:Alcohol dehydrogenase catalytic domain-containing protein n=1 Tax=Candidatus Anaerostipes excrementavium TaxID=2838463 RepID=A0A9D2B881_9FIRM|nr:alcohol dehydrogenase catalytic domain-containing protein [uncultured Anaerostipes sp.]HIX66656.1 alcohol dehydrogenase catalytic domain-containing protein [Candidatus Anaerostipes excrementavium]